MFSARPSFSKLLPLAALTIWALAMSVITTLRYVNLRHVSAHGKGVRFHSHEYDFTVPPGQFASFSVFQGAHAVTRPVQAANLPGIFTEMAVSAAARTWPYSYRPKLFGPTKNGLFGWRGIIFTVYCLPFWWALGFGFDALIYNRRLKWPAFLIGTIVFIVLAIVAASVPWFYNSPDYQDIHFTMFGVVLWALMLSVFPIAWLRQLRQTRRVAPL